MDIRTELFALQDKAYKEFNDRLVPTAEVSKSIGIRVPALRALAKDLWKSHRDEAEVFLRYLPHTYLEEQTLHSLLINEMKDIDRVYAALEDFLPYVDNWQTTDILKPLCLKKDRERLESAARKGLQSPHVFEVRFAVLCFMNFFLKDWYRKDQLQWVAEVACREYYVQMGQAWYYATALIDHEPDVLALLAGDRLDPWVVNKTIQKARESFRIRPERKEDLLKLKKK